jgi:hypothetical protein
MPLFVDANRTELRQAGWHSRGYLPHFDGRALPQFITIHLADSIPLKVIRRWREELKPLTYEQERIVLQRRIERYLDQGYGDAFSDHLKSQAWFKTRCLSLTAPGTTFSHG